MPPLNGTEKQITWAEKIRAEKLAEVETLLASFETRWADAISSRKASEAEVAPVRAEYQALAAQVAANPDASWWISVRAYTATLLLKDAKNSK